MDVQVDAVVLPQDVLANTAMGSAWNDRKFLFQKVTRVTACPPTMLH